MSVRKFSFTTLVLILLIFSFTFSTAHAGNSVIKPGQALVLQVEGLAKVKTTQAWKTLEVEDIINNGDEIKTLEQTYCLLVLSDGSTIKLGENTHIKLSLPEGEKKKSAIQIFIGKIWNDVSKAFDKNSTYEVKTPNAIAAVKGTTFEVFTNGEVDELSVFNGEVLFETGDALKQVAGDERIKCLKPGVLSELAKLEKKDLTPWQKWNLEVDSEIARMRGDSADTGKLTAQQKIKIREIMKKYKNPYRLSRTDIMLENFKKSLEKVREKKEK
ncbi:MAG: FecR domain-containing protein [Vulcanimicrobiota bacterium]